MLKTQVCQTKDVGINTEHKPITNTQVKYIESSILLYMDHIMYCDYLTLLFPLYWLALVKPGLCRSKGRRGQETYNHDKTPSNNSIEQRRISRRNIPQPCNLVPKEEKERTGLVRDA